MKWVQFILVTLILTTILGVSFKASNPNTNAYRIGFGVKVGILPTGGITQYAIIHYRNGLLTNIQPTDLPTLIKIATGKFPIPRTNKFENFFKENQVSHKLVLTDSSYVPNENYLKAFDSIWKIRFDAHPFDSRQGNGWSVGRHRPSLKQQEYLFYTYGSRAYDQDYICDTSFYKLLRDVIDPAWIEYYKSLY